MECLNEMIERIDHQIGDRIEDEGSSVTSKQRKNASKAKSSAKQKAAKGKK